MSADVKNRVVHDTIPQPTVREHGAQPELNYQNHFIIKKIKFPNKTDKLKHISIIENYIIHLVNKNISSRAKSMF